jgi:hypothetical protein
MARQLFCSVCKTHHDASQFASRQHKKSATIRVCKSPKVADNVTRMTLSQYEDYMRFERFVKEDYYHKCNDTCNRYYDYQPNYFFNDGNY